MLRALLAIGFVASLGCGGKGDDDGWQRRPRDTTYQGEVSGVEFRFVGPAGLELERAPRPGEHVGLLRWEAEDKAIGAVSVQITRSQRDNAGALEHELEFWHRDKEASVSSQVLVDGFRIKIRKRHGVWIIRRKGGDADGMVCEGFAGTAWRSSRDPAPAGPWLEELCESVTVDSTTP